jgi:DNA-binding SARP family transcriptional activator/tetratricopeptide (TPR) repeat protein
MVPSRARPHIHRRPSTRRQLALPHLMPDACVTRTDLRFLGGATLLRDGVPIEGPASRRHPRALLALLATAPARSLSRTRALGLLWPETDESTGRNRLTSTLYLLRQGLGAGAVISNGGELRLDPDCVTCDVWRFREELARGDPRTAVGGYGGPFMDGFYLEGNRAFGEYVELERHRLHRAWREAVEALARESTDSGRPAEAVGWWQALAKADPLDTSAVSGVVMALVDAGNRAAALRAARTHVRRLREELDMEPGEAFTTLLAAVSDPGSSEARAGAGIPTDPRPTLAVLPFRSEEAGPTPFGHGLHSGLLTRLSELAGLSVIARESVERFRGGQEPIRAIREALGVEWVLEGDVLIEEREFAVDVRLIHAADERLVWGRRWTGAYSAGEIFGAQADIAGRIVKSLPLSPSPGERLLLSRSPTDSLDAFRLGTQGRMHLEHRTRAEMERALACFEEALRLDPAYAPAWVGLADTLGLLHSYGFRDSRVLSRAEEAIETALDLAPGSAEAHAALGRLRGQERRHAEAVEHMRRALELQPGYAEAHNWAAVGHLIGGDPAEAVASARRAVALNPLSPEVLYNLAMGLLVTGHPEEAIREVRRTLELRPGYESARFLEGLVLRETGQANAAVKVLEGLEVPWAGAAPRTVLALARIDQGSPEPARSLAVEVAAGGHPFDQGLILAALGDRDEAFQAFARETHDGVDFDVTYWPTVAVRYFFTDVWDGVRDDPRYPGLVQRIDAMWGL